MLESFLSALFPNQLCVLIGVGLPLLAVAEIGYRMGARIPPQEDIAFQK